MPSAANLPRGELSLLCESPPRAARRSRSRETGRTGHDSSGQGAREGRQEGGCAVARGMGFWHMRKEVEPRSDLGAAQVSLRDDRYRIETELEGSRAAFEEGRAASQYFASHYYKYTYENKCRRTSDEPNLLASALRAIGHVRLNRAKRFGQTPASRKPRSPKVVTQYKESKRCPACSRSRRPWRH